ncbi:MAG: hypothetical protein DI585_02500 [Pseudomonas fluorescens]|nr:MAG: hypothetical protein DI585_02500 [Pseudomonas fluorescens]
MKKFMFATALMTVVAAGAYAQYAGPTSTVAITSVKQILAKPIDDHPVMIEGYVTKKLGGEEYTFADETGEIRAEIDDKLFIGLTIDDKTRVQVIGEVDTSLFRTPEIDVESIRAI